MGQLASSDEHYLCYTLEAVLITAMEFSVPCRKIRCIGVSLNFVMPGLDVAIDAAQLPEFARLHSADGVPL